MMNLRFKVIFKNLEELVKKKKIRRKKLKNFVRCVIRVSKEGKLEFLDFELNFIFN